MTFAGVGALFGGLVTAAAFGWYSAAAIERLPLRRLKDKYQSTVHSMASADSGSVVGVTSAVTKPPSVPPPPKVQSLVATEPAK